jgi:hypothetical protein
MTAAVGRSFVAHDVITICREMKKRICPLAEVVGQNGGRIMGFHHPGRAGEAATP